MTGDEIRALLNAGKQGDFSSLAKALTWIERHSAAEVLNLKELQRAAKPCLRIGITGPPGAGKSTLTSRLISEFRKRQMRIGVLAIDPSSPFTRGAILGDRIRYQDHFNDSQVFIRSLGTRGSLGGLSSAAYLMLRAFDYCEFDLVLIETVGVGQTELEIVGVADFIIVVLVPESGDAIQAMKAGLLEIADVFVVNKADRPGADALANELQAQGDPQAQVFKVIALSGEGVLPLVDKALQVSAQQEVKSSRDVVEQLRNEAKALLRAQMENKIERTASGITSVEDLAKTLSTWSRP